MAEEPSEESSGTSFQFASRVIPLELDNEDAMGDEEQPFSLGAKGDDVIVEAAKAATQETLSRFKRLHYFMLVVSCVFVLISMAFSYYAMRHPFSEALTEDQTTGLLRTTAMLNKSADVCEDPWQYFCGGFLSNTTLPTGKSYYAASFSLVAETVESQLLEVMEEARHWPFLTTLQQSCLNQTYRSDRGMRPISSALALIINPTNLNGLMAASAQARLQHGISVQPFFAIDIEIDVRSVLPMKHMLNIGSGNLLFSSPSYYSNATLMSIYASWIQSLFRVAGFNAFTLSDANDLISLETELQNAKMDISDMWDPTVLYNQYAAAELYSLCPGILQPYIDTLIINNSITSANVVDVGYLYAACSRLASTPYQTLENAVLLSFFVHTFPYLGPAQVSVMDQFSVLLYGSDPSEKTQLERCTAVSESVLGMLISQYYVDKHFTEEKKQKVKDMVLDIKESFLLELDRFDWMDESTKAGAISKFSTLSYQIGFPDEWPSVDRLVSRVSGKVFTEDKFWENMVTLKRAHDSDNLRLLKQPVTAEELHMWLMDPIEVNAYYAAESNAIVFPAAILQDPFYSEDAPESYNFGAIGAIIGHELGHMNSGSGAYYNSAGQLSDWMSASSKAAWETRMDCFAEQFSELTFDSIQIDGQMVLGEAVADFWGLKHAYMTMKRRRQANSTAFDEEEAFVKKHYDMTPDELFMTSFAQTHCSISLPQYSELLVRLDVHPLDKFRVEQTFAQSPEYADIFNCPSDSKFNPSQRCALD